MCLDFTSLYMEEKDNTTNYLLKVAANILHNGRVWSAIFLFLLQIVVKKIKVVGMLVFNILKQV